MHVKSPSRSVPATGTSVRERGFTIVELMITIAVAAILLMIAVPSFRSMLASSKLTAATNALVGGLSEARMEAIQRNSAAQFCSDAGSSNTTDTLGKQCSISGGGAVVATTGSTATTVRAAPASLATPVQLSGSIVAIRFNGQGIGYQAGVTSTPYNSTVATLCSTSVSSNNRVTINMAAGSIVTTTPSTGSCP
ncbi:MAG: hypothetical protein RSP_11090 [Rhodanobacter sp.]